MSGRFTSWNHAPRCFELLHEAMRSSIDVPKTVHATKAYDELTSRQRDHMEAFTAAAAYENSIRPKHHHALHLGAQYKATQCIPIVE